MIERTALAIEFLALGLWVGGLAAFAFVFAPAAFHAIPDTRLFGTLTARILGILGATGFGFGGVTIAMELVRARDPGVRRGAIARIALVAVMLIATDVESAFVIPQMVATAPYAVLAHSDPRWVAFDAQHHRSSLIYGVVLLSGLAAIASAGFTARPRPPQRPLSRARR